MRPPIDASIADNPAFLQQGTFRPAHDHINRREPFHAMHHILGLGICRQHVVLGTIPDISKSCPMKHETTFLHESCDFLPRGWPAEEDRLTGDDAGVAARAVNAMNSPVEAKQLCREPNAFQILFQGGKAIRTEHPPIFPWMRGFDGPAIGRKPNLVLRAPGLSKTRWKLDRVHAWDFQKRRQKGRLDSLSRPIFSKSFTCFSQASRVTAGCSRTIRARRSRSAWQISSMLLAPAGMI